MEKQVCQFFLDFIGVAGIYCIDYLIRFLYQVRF